jgi:hypothetical protein
VETVAVRANLPLADIGPMADMPVWPRSIGLLHLMLDAATASLVKHRAKFGNISVGLVAATRPYPSFQGKSASETRARSSASIVV